MATTRMTATNTFSKGLIMDFNPMVTKTDCLVNALNATLLTYNGNELQLQQDMGNGRVETAYLPEGYVPVGSCEFGDIIYIVSYNPLENKSQIGCFPSPERNITSDEITDMQQNLTNADFQKMGSDGPTGVLNATSVKKIIYGNKNMNPGDKYIIYEEGNPSKLGACGSTLSDYDNTSHSHNTWPKLVKLSVVSIEDSGKIVDLNASVKWYDNDYYIAHLENGPTGASVDIDSYRSLVSSAYAVFQSKVSGKLAILAELEAIDEFSCTYDVYTEKYNEDDPQSTVSKGYTRYKIYFYTAWGNEHNDVNPSGFLFTKSEWTKDSGGGQIWVPTLQENGDYMYKPGESTEDSPDVPVKAASTIDESTKLVASYDAEAVYGYTRLYDLGNPTASDYKDFIENKSYNAQIEAIIDWKEEGGTHTAIVDNTNYDNLRQVTQVTRILDQDTGEPVGSDVGEFKYVYNLDIYSYDSEQGQYIYQTKGLNGDPIELAQITLTDDVINNYFHKDIPTLITSRTTEDIYDLKTSTFIEVPVDETEETVTAEVSNDLSHLIWNYEIAPVMPYGVLDWLAISGNIDFSKLGTGLIDLAAWRYYNSGNVSTLTWGLEAYPEPNKGIAEVVFDFYDNQGKAASYHITDKTSFAGTFTENIVLGQRNSSYKMNNIDADGNTYIHAGTLDENGTVYLNTSNKAVSEEEKDKYKIDSGPYLDDSGTLYPNILYLVRITVKYCTKDVVGNYNADSTKDFKTFYRWYWTNGLFNEMYYSVQDFDVLQPRLTIDFSATFNTKGEKGANKLIPQQVTYQNQADLDYNEYNDKLWATVGAYVYYINQNCEDDNVGNVLLTIEPGLAEGFDTFNLSDDKLDLIEKVEAYLGQSSITKSIDAPSLIHTGSDHTEVTDDCVQPITASQDELCSHEQDGWDRSGYASYHYGTSNRWVSDNFLDILGVTEGQHDYNPSPEEQNVEVQKGDSSTDIYDSDEAYAAYLDSFSLNLLNSTLITQEEKSFYYYNGQGEQITPPHYQMATFNLSEIRENSTVENGGIKLSLTGIAFSKIYATEISKDSNSKMLKSIVHNTNNSSTTNSLWAAGLHLYDGHLYFNDVVSWGMGEASGVDSRFTASYSTGIEDNSWTGSVNIDSYENSNHDSWEPHLDDDTVQEYLKAGVTSPVVAFMIARPGKKGGKITHTYSDIKWNSVKTPFGLASRTDDHIHQSSDVCPCRGVENWDSDDLMIHAFIVFDQDQNIAVPICDWFVGQWNNQRCYKGYTEDSQPYYTLADMLGSLFAQLYVAESDGNMCLLNNFAYLQDYTEYWNKDIIININLDDLEQTSKDKGYENVYDATRDLVTIQMQKMSNYYKYLIENTDFNYDEASVTTNNIDIDLFGTQRTIEFQYSVPYDLGNLIYEYNQLSETHNIIALSVVDRDNISQETKVFAGNIIDNTLYTWEGDNAVQFSGASTIYMADYFTQVKDSDELLLVNRESPILMKTSSMKNISQVLQCNDGVISWHNLTQFSNWNSKYILKWHGTGKDDNPFLREIPLISFFNIYKPGS